MTRKRAPLDGHAPGVAEPAPPALANGAAFVAPDLVPGPALDDVEAPLVDDEALAVVNGERAELPAGASEVGNTLQTCSRRSKSSTPRPAPAPVTSARARR
jgi:hypothetical protein